MEIGRIICYGCNSVLDEWRCDHHIGINRLFHIHSGKGGFRYKGRDYEFKPDFLYFIPYSDDFAPYSDASDPVLHTYCDLELIPPIITDGMLAADASADKMLESAVSAFDSGGRLMFEKGMTISFSKADKPFRQLTLSSMIYIISYIARYNNAPAITDETVLKALKLIHEKMSESISVSYLAKECFMNVDSFIRHFSKVMGVTPYAYLRNLRLHTARCLLDNGMKLNETAELTGYSDASSLLHALAKNSLNK